MGASAGRRPIDSSNACGGHSNGRSLREPRQNNLLPTRVRHSAKAGIGGEPKWRERQALTEVADPLRPPKTIGGRGRIPREKRGVLIFARILWRRGGSGQRAIHLNGVQPKMAWKSSVSAVPPHRANQRIGKVWQNPRGKPQVLVFRTFVWRAESFSRGAAKPESNMIQISQSSGVWVSLVAGLGLITSVARAQELKK